MIKKKITNNNGVTAIKETPDSETENLKADIIRIDKAVSNNILDTVIKILWSA